ncbi:MAG: SDR family NAD(P)-dependent oxidoreductase, partial [Deltaproteobacteria bacterium]|nr:SDR family NAD(P)-dependent oxidoreductase [Deltaproteobacteria bacterium]
MRLQDKAIVVTGGSRGMGRAYCLGLAREGAKVIVNYVSDEKAANDVVQEISQMGGEAHAFKADVGTKSDVQ